MGPIGPTEPPLDPIGPTEPPLGPISPDPGLIDPGDIIDGGLEHLASHITELVVRNRSNLNVTVSVRVLRFR